MKKWNDSAQMILIAAFAIGIGIVVLTVMLNNIIYAGNIASEANIETNVFDFTNTIKVTILAYEKAYTGNSIDSAYMSNYTRKMSESHAISGFIFTLSNDALKEPYFTENGLASGNSNWTVAERVNKTDIFEIMVNTSVLGNETNHFMVEAVDQSGKLWSLTAYNSGSACLVNVTDSNDTVIYSSSYGIGSTLHLNLTNTTSSFHFNSLTAGKQYKVNIVNGNQTAGTLTLSGDLINGKPFEIRRYHVINTTMSLNKNGHMEMNVTIPVTLPRGQL
jgi:hypothetical protein